jgi:hypothetical protein
MFMIVLSVLSLVVGTVALAIQLYDRWQVVPP